MIKKIISLIIISLAMLYANEFVISSYKPLPSDQSARVYEKLDDNGDACAIIKVKTDIEKQFQFDSGLKLPHPAEKKYAGEYWIYVSPGEQSLRIMAEGFTPKRISLTSYEIKSHQVYEILVKAKEENKISVVIMSTPLDAEKWIDGERLGTGNNFEIKIGQWKLEVRKSGYKTYNKIISVDKKNILFRNITLVEIEQAMLTLKSNPNGAIIYINNVEEGQTNKQLFKFPGEYTLRVTKSKYETIEQSITVIESGDNIWNFNLVKTTAILTLNIQPSDAEIYINGERKTSRSPELAPGHYRIEVKKEGWNSEIRTITIEKGENQTQSFTLKQKTGKLQLVIEPMETKIMMKRGTQHIDSWSGSKYKKDIPVGKYDLQFSSEGYSRQNKTINIEENKTTLLDVKMIKQSPATASQSTGTSKSLQNIEMIFVRGGTFQMGSNSDESDEQPIHQVTLSNYYMGKYEVKHEEYIEFLNSAGVFSNGVELIDMDDEGCAVSHNGSFYFNGSSYADNIDCPVIEVSWYGAINYCNWLSEQNGLQRVYTINGGSVTANFSKSGYRLPTEAEWEYAARGGQKNKGYTYSGSNNIGDVAWHTSNSGSKTHAGGEKQSNELGLYDMTGNVWEWCWDWYGDYSSSSQTNPTGLTSGSYRVRRGGSWDSLSYYCRIANRYSYTPSYSCSYLGFRLTRNAR